MTLRVNPFRIGCCCDGRWETINLYFPCCWLGNWCYLLSFYLKTHIGKKHQLFWRLCSAKIGKTPFQETKLRWVSIFYCRRLKLQKVKEKLIQFCCLLLVLVKKHRLSSSKNVSDYVEHLVQNTFWW